MFYRRNGEVFYRRNGEVFYRRNLEVFIGELGSVLSKEFKVFYPGN